MMMAREDQQATTEAIERSGMHPAVIASGASVLLSLYVFFIKGDHDRGIFFGLWAPTILAFASYFEQVRMQKKLEGLTGRRLMDRVESMVSSQ